MFSSATGNPLPQITWSLDGLALAEAWHVRVGDFVSDAYTVNSYVNISSAKVSDGGLYTCLATNSAGSARHASRVNILGVPAIRPLKNITALSGRQLDLQCPYYGFPITEVFWTKG